LLNSYKVEELFPVKEKFRNVVVVVESKTDESIMTM